MGLGELGDIVKACRFRFSFKQGENSFLTPKGRRPFFGPFLDIGQAIVDAIFVQKILNFW
jgi:hypothetical protein